MTEQYAIECRQITKAFGSVVANDKIDLTVRYGEIMALLGENGSGKTTLMNMLSGIYHPDAGSILVGGKEVSINSPVDSRNLGIGMIHQHFKLVDVFSAMDNIVLGTKGKRLGRKALREKIEALGQSFGLEIEPEKKVYDMSVSEKQTVEILKVLYRGAQILILDEPTAVLTPQETDRLFKILRRMREQGCAIIIITHKLNEVLSISDRVTILRKGKSIETVETAGCDEKKLTELMVGRPISLNIERPEMEKRETILKIVDLTVDKSDGGVALDDISFEIKTGEILGVAGVAGSGQKELCETLTGLMDAKKGAILYRKENIIGKTPAEIIRLGISMSFVPEDRLGMGLVASMGMVDNMLLKSYSEGKGLFVDRKPAREMAERLIGELGIVTPGVDTPVRMMSGGNVQKVLLGREIESSPQVLITAYPVRGLDINSSYLIYDLLNQQKKKGVAVVYIGEDLDVLLEFPIVKDTTPNMMNPRLYTTSYNKPQGQQFDTAVLSFIKLQYTEKSCKMINIFVLVTILGHLPVILSAKRKGSDNMKQILIVEDDNLLNKTLTYNLELDGYTITSVLNARTAAESLKTNIFDLVLLDINLPDGNGYDLCRLIKPEHPDTVVIFLTANDQESNQIRGYEAGAVDYITKPFSISALQRKIKAMFAMLEHHKPAKDIYEDGSLFLDFSEQFASLNGKPLALSAMEYKMLNLFLKNPKQVLTRQQLLERLWDIDEKYVDEHTLTTSISRIRSKIEADGDTYIKTVYGMGYQWTGGEKK